MSKTEETVKVILELPKQIAKFIKETYPTDNLEETLTKGIVEDSLSQLEGEDDTEITKALMKKYDLIPIFKQYGILPSYYREDHNKMSETETPQLGKVHLGYSNEKETEAFETVQIPKVTAEFIEKQPFFKLYESVDEFVMDAIRLRLENLKLTEKKPTSDSKKDLDLQLIPVKIELCKPFYDFIEEYRQYFGSQYTVELICMQMIYSQVKRLFNELDSFVRKKDSFLDKSDFFMKYSYLGTVSFDDPEEETD